MKTIRALYRAQGAGLEMPKPGSPGRARTYAIFGIVAAVLILVPSTVLVGYITYLLSNLLMFFGERSYALTSMIHIISAFTMVFMMPVMFNVLYFADDLAFLRTLPVTPAKLYQARFWHTYRTESFMTVGVMIAMYIGWFVALVNNFGAAEAANPVTILASVMGLILITALPVIYCSIIASLLMIILRRARRTSVFYHASTVMFILFAFVFLLSFRGQGGANIEHYVDMLVAGESSFNDVCDVVFFSTPMICRAMAEHDLLQLLIPAVATCAFYGLMVLIAHLTYTNGLYTSAVLARGTKKLLEGRRAAADTTYRPVRSGVFKTLLTKEIRTLTRSMTYRTNCVYVNLIWPVLGVIFFVLSRSNVNLLRFLSLYRGGRASSRVWVLMVVVAVAFVASGLNSIASTAFTREGAHLDLVKYLPAPYTTVIWSKIAASVIITYVPVAATIGVMSYYLGARWYVALMYLGLALLSVVIAAFTGLAMDSMTPYTVWSDEAASLRGNMNCFFNLAAQLLVAAAVCGATYGIYIWQGKIIWCDLAAAVMLVILTLVSVLGGVPYVRRNIARF